MIEVSSLVCYIQTSSVGDCVSNGMIVNITGPDTLYYTINDLSINTNYTVEVRGKTGAGLGEPVTDVGTTDEDGIPYLLDLCCRGTIIFLAKIKDKTLQIVPHCSII